MISIRAEIQDIIDGTVDEHNNVLKKCPTYRSHGGSCSHALLRFAVVLKWGVCATSCSQ